MKETNVLKKTLLACVLVALAGCDNESAKSAQAPATQEKVAVQSILHKDAIYLPNGENLGVDGKLRSYDLLSNDQGHFDRYVVESSKEMMSLEGNIYATLAKQGYARNVKDEKPGLYVVRYTKRGAPTISMSYESATNSTTDFKTLMKITWKNS
ncbi:hypothetical protein V9K81_07060 [Pseudomonas monteilii]|uniref:hypothetical protein n=1 Tax=Pseudomonas monteilii TaxID=76759 RepID=UPI0030CE21B4